MEHRLQWDRLGAGSCTRNCSSHNYLHSLVDLLRGLLWFAVEFPDRPEESSGGDRAGQHGARSYLVSRAFGYDTGEAFHTLWRMPPSWHLRGASLSSFAGVSLDGSSDSSGIPLAWYFPLHPFFWKR